MSVPQRVPDNPVRLVLYTKLDLLVFRKASGISIRELIRPFVVLPLDMPRHNPAVGIIGGQKEFHEYLNVWEILEPVLVYSMGVPLVVSG